MTMTKNALIKEIEAIGGDVKSVRERVQACLIQIYQRTEKHGDYSLANLLFEKCEGLNRKLITDHMRKYCGLKTTQDFTEEELALLKADEDKWNKIKDNVILGWSGKAYVKEHFDMAKANKWWSGAKAEKKALQMDINAMIDNICKRIVAGKNAIDEAKRQGKALEGVNIMPDREHVEKLIATLPVNDFALDIIEQKAA